MQGKELVLSRRLSALADMVTRGNAVVDVGCDHGFLSIYLVRSHISPYVLAMDVRKGPLSAAKSHVEEYQLGDYIETRLSDGLREYQEGEARSLVCAGMGGPLMQRLLTDSRDKARSLQELILQPQSELKAFRRFLREEGYRLLDENILLEEGKYYFLMKACYEGKYGGETEAENLQLPEALADRFGSILLQRREPVLLGYLQRLERTQQDIIDRLREQETGRTQKRLAELKLEQELVRQAMALY